MVAFSQKKSVKEVDLVQILNLILTNFDWQFPYKNERSHRLCKALILQVGQVKITLQYQAAFQRRKQTVFIFTVFPNLWISLYNKEQLRNLKTDSVTKIPSNFQHKTTCYPSHLKPPPSHSPPHFTSIDIYPSLPSSTHLLTHSKHHLSFSNSSLLPQTAYT